MIFRKDKEALRRLDGRCVTVYQGVVLTPGPLSCDKSQSSRWMTFLGRGHMTIKSLLEDLASDRYGEFSQSVSIKLLFFWCSISKS